MPACLIEDCDREGVIQITIYEWACDDHFDEACEAIRDWREGY